MQLTCWRLSRIPTWRAAGDSGCGKWVEIGEDLTRALDGMVFRNVPGSDLIDCIRRVAAASIVCSAQILPPSLPRTPWRPGSRPADAQGDADRRADRAGCKNRQIAEQLHTKEQVIKNYLRSIYDKTGVSDRLELALFTIHHRVLAEAAARAGDLLQAKSA